MFSSVLSGWMPVSSTAMSTSRLGADRSVFASAPARRIRRLDLRIGVWVRRAGETCVAAWTRTSGAIAVTRGSALKALRCDSLSCAAKPWSALLKRAPSCAPQRVLTSVASEVAPAAEVVCTIHRLTGSADLPLPNTGDTPDQDEQGRTATVSRSPQTHAPKPPCGRHGHCAADYDRPVNDNDSSPMIPAGLLSGRKALIFGVANDHSIAWGIARALHAAGAEVGFSSIEALIEKRVQPLADSIGSSFVEPCDVQNDADIERVFARWQREQGSLDILVHALAFAKREELDGRFVDTSRAGFALALDISAYSLVALARGAAPLMAGGGSIMTLSYYGAEKVVAELQRHGRGQGRARGVGALPRRGPGPRRHPRQRDLRRADPHARRERCVRLQDDVGQVPRRRAAAPQRDDRRRRRD